MPTLLTNQMTGIFKWGNRWLWHALSKIFHDAKYLGTVALFTFWFPFLSLYWEYCLAKPVTLFLNLYQNGKFSLQIAKLCMQNVYFPLKVFCFCFCLFCCCFLLFFCLFVCFVLFFLFVFFNSLMTFLSCPKLDDPIIVEPTRTDSPIINKRYFCISDNKIQKY